MFIIIFLFYHENTLEISIGNILLITSKVFQGRMGFGNNNIIEITSSNHNSY